MYIYLLNLSVEYAVSIDHKTVDFYNIETSNDSVATHYEMIQVINLIQEKDLNRIGRDPKISDETDDKSSMSLSPPLLAAVDLSGSEQHMDKSSFLQATSSSQVVSSQVPATSKLNTVNHASGQAKHAIAALPTIVLPRILHPKPTSSGAENGVARTQQSMLAVSGHNPPTFPLRASLLHTETRLDSSHPASMHSSKPAVSSGFVLATTFYEQQNMGSKNMLQLQCWAASLGILVVKPTMKDSFLKTPLSEDDQKKALKFEDFFNLTDWSREAKHYGYSALVDWNEFLAKAPKKVITVSFKYPTLALLKLRQKKGEAVIHPAQGERYKDDCNIHWLNEHDVSFLQSSNFVIVRQVCFNFLYGDQLSSEGFNRHIYGEFSPDQVTVVMDMWRGIGSGQRVLVQHSCHSVPAVNEVIAPSNRVVSDAETYAKIHLAGGPYLAIIGRLEMSSMTTHKSISYCLEAMQQKWKELKEVTGLPRTFLSIDIGRYGSKHFRFHLDPTLKDSLAHLLQSVYGMSTTVESWESTFQSVSGLKDAGYIGLLQMVTVSRAKCILFVGGGAFQRHALHLYQGLHPNPRDHCLHVVHECTSRTKLPVS